MYRILGQRGKRFFFFCSAAILNSGHRIPILSTATPRSRFFVKIVFLGHGFGFPVVYKNNNNNNYKEHSCSNVYSFPGSERFVDNIENCISELKDMKISTEFSRSNGYFREIECRIKFFSLNYSLGPNDEHAVYGKEFNSSREATFSNRLDHALAGVFNTQQQRTKTLAWN